MKFEWHKFWALLAVFSLPFGALGLTILFGLAAWYCWPNR